MGGLSLFHHTHMPTLLLAAGNTRFARVYPKPLLAHTHAGPGSSPHQDRKSIKASLLEGLR